MEKARYSALLEYDTVIRLTHFIGSTSFPGAVKHSLVKQEVIPMSYPIYKRPFP